MADDKSKVAGTGTYNSSTNSLNTYRASGMPSVGNDSQKLTVVTTNISITSNGNEIGFAQNFTVSEQRTITKVQELGTEGVVQSVAGNTNGGTIALSRFALINSRLFNALGLTATGKFTKIGDTTSGYLNGDGTKERGDGKVYSSPFRTLKDQRVPLEIIIKSCGTAKEKYIDCWLTSYSKSIASSTITITETANISYSDVVKAI